ncbi:WD40 repeat domain-containing protein [Roseivirga sp.]|uniref:WD40 repeat domain-containing protein n=1 Tax=Roseivirga sp. TaxID=1964215 RepID=UPI003B51DA28
MSKIQVTKVETLAGHQDCVYILEKGPEPHLFFSSGGDGVIAQWDLNDLENGRMLAKVPSSVYALCYYPERNALIVGQNFDGIHIIDLTERKEKGSIKLGNTQIFDIKVVNDHVFCALGNGEVHVLNLTTLETVKVIRGSEQSARCIAISEVNQELAVGFSDNCIRIYNLQNLSEKKVIQAHKISVFTVQYSPDQRYLISGSRDAHLKVWEVSQAYALKQSIVAHMYAINHLVFSADGKHFVTCSMDKSIKVWDARTFQLLKVIDKARHAGHGTSVNKVLWTNFNNLLLSASDDRSISIWDINFNFSEE